MLEENSTLVNGQEYAFADISTIVNGVVLAGVSAIEYGVDQKHSNVYAKGKKPVSMASGQESYTCKLTMLQSQFEALQRSLPKGVSVTRSKPFGITVSYGQTATDLVVDQLDKCRILKWTKKHATATENMEVELDILPFDIRPNI